MIELKTTMDGEIVGYASLFGGPADAVNDIVAPGAYRASLAAGMPLMLREHNGAPVGEWTEATEDEIGLRVRGIVTDPATLADLRSSRLDGLSIGFVATKARRDAQGRRVLEEIDLREISIVRRPCSSRARVLSVKSSPPAAGAAITTSKESSPMDTTTEAAPEADATETKAVGEVVAEAVTAAVKPIADRLAKVETVLRRPGAAPLPAEAKSADGERKVFSTFLRSGREALDHTEVKALRVSDDASGGYLAPTDFRNELLKQIVEASPIRALSTVTTTSAGELVMPKMTGTSTAAWTSETGARSASEPTFGQIKIEAHEAAVYIDVSQRLLEDSGVNLQAELTAMLATEYARLEGAAFVSGDGTGKPRGIMAHPDLPTLKNGHTTTLSADKLIALMYSVKAAYRSRGVWLMNASTIGAIRSLKSATTSEYLFRESFADGVPPSLLGKAIYEVPDMADIGADAMPILFGDIKTAYRVAERVGVSILRDPYSVATSGLVRFHSRRRCGGDLVMPEAVRALVMAV